MSMCIATLERQVSPQKPHQVVLQDTPSAVDGVSASGAPFVQKKRGNLRHALLDNACREATARLAQTDLVGTQPTRIGDMRGHVQTA